MKRFAFLIVLTTSNCLTPKFGADTKEQAFELLKNALQKNNIRAVYNLLDRKTRWSIDSAFKEQREIYSLVKKNYPSSRQAQELARVKQAAIAANPKEYFESYIKTTEILDSLSKITNPISKSGTKNRVEFKTTDQIFVFCSEDNKWFYCGLQETFEHLKIRTSRDLLTVQENIKAYKL